eukprot:7548729-Pyramimonas_sp.AAC.1
MATDGYRNPNRPLSTMRHFDTKTRTSLHVPHSLADPKVWPPAVQMDQSDVGSVGIFARGTNQT